MPISEFFIKSKQNNKKSLNFKLINRVLLVLVSIGIVYYVAGTNDLVVKGFDLQSLKKHSSSLEREHKDFDTYATSLKSYNNLQKRVEKLGMIEAGGVDYIRGKSVVAVR